MTGIFADPGPVEVEAAQQHLAAAVVAARRVPDIDPATPVRAVHSVGVVGAGTMGGGIAMCFANAGLAVVLVDINQAAIDRGMQSIRRNYGSSVKRGRITQEVCEQRMALITPAADYAALAEVDLVIEAALENMALKQEIFGRLDRVCRPGAILATNTSSLDINALARATARPGDVLGLHFFSPANVMALLEIVRGAHSAPDVMATAVAIAQRIGKVGVLSRVAYGFIGNRVMEPYGREAERLVLEGATPAQVDGVLEAFGMAMGILAVFDMAGVDVGDRMRSQSPMKPADPAFYGASGLLCAKGWLGQKTGRGYYRYDPGARARIPDEDLNGLLWAEGKRLGIPPRAATREQILERCLCAMVNEAAEVLREGVALRASDIDVVYTTGYGFPRTRGGPLFWADGAGLPEIVRRIDRLAAQHGPRCWQVSPLLRELAAQGRSFAQWDRAHAEG